MKPLRTRLFLSLICAAYLLSFMSCARSDPSSQSDRTDVSASVPERIISFAPSVTEILYELGLGGSVIGVTQFCKYPPAAAAIENKVGGHADRNYEMILRLKPDLAIILKEQTDMAAFFNQYGIRYVTVGSDSVGGILESIRTIAYACGAGERGETLVTELRGRMVYVRSETAKPRVLLCAGRGNVGGGAVSACHAAGAMSFYSELVEIAGGVNVLKDVGQAYPSISAEAIIRFDPDIIIDISSAYSDNLRREHCDDWNVFTTVSAIKSNRVHCLTGDYLTIPGPRFIKILETFLSLIQ